jgi:hypothetical protein
MYAGTAPQNPTPLSGQYITLTSPPGLTTRTMSPAQEGATYDTVPVDFSVWSTSTDPTSAWTVVEAVKTLYDDAALSVSGHTFISAERMLPGTPIEDPTDKSWQIVVSYDYAIGA